MRRGSAASGMLVVALVVTTVALGVVAEVRPAAATPVVHPCYYPDTHTMLPGFGGKVRRGRGGVLISGGRKCVGVNSKGERVFATVWNTRRILYEASPDPGYWMSIDLSGGPLAPGWGDEPGSSDEIEIVVHGDVQLADLNGGPGDDHIRVGTRGVNLNADERDGVDADLVWRSGDVWFIDGRRGDDVISTNGGKGTGTGVPYQEFLGGPGDDRLNGSSRVTWIHGQGGRDTISSRPYGLALASGGFGRDRFIGGRQPDVFLGMGGDDRLFGGRGGDWLDGGTGNVRVRGGPGADVYSSVGTGNDRGPTIGWEDRDSDGADEVWGGRGRDTASYRYRSREIRASLDDVANDGLAEAYEGDNIHTDVENLAGSSYNDTLIGSAKRNVLEGDWGADAFIATDGAFDIVDGGDDTTNDSCVCDPIDDTRRIP